MYNIGKVPLSIVYNPNKAGISPKLCSTWESWWKITIFMNICQDFQLGHNKTWLQGTLNIQRVSQPEMCPFIANSLALGHHSEKMSPHQSAPWKQVTLCLKQNNNYLILHVQWNLYWEDPSISCKVSLYAGWPFIAGYLTQGRFDTILR